MILVAFTAIASFLVPTQVDSGAVLRFLLTILAGILGGYGIVIGLLIIFIHLAGLCSFGIPYLASLAPLITRDLKDGPVGTPLWAMLTRPRSIYRQDPQGQEFRLIPHPPSQGDQSNRRWKDLIVLVTLTVMGLAGGILDITGVTPNLYKLFRP